MVKYREGYWDIPFDALDIYDEVAARLKTDLECESWFTDWTDVDFESEDFKEKLDEAFYQDNTAECYQETYYKSLEITNKLHFWNGWEEVFAEIGTPKNAQELGIIALEDAYWNMMGRIYICDKIKELALGKEED